MDSSFFVHEEGRLKMAWAFWDRLPINRLLCLAKHHACPQWLINVILVFWPRRDILCISKANIQMPCAIGSSIQIVFSTEGFVGNLDAHLCTSMHWALKAALVVFEFDPLLDGSVSFHDEIRTDPLSARSQNPNNWYHIDRTWNEYKMLLMCEK